MAWLLYRWVWQVETPVHIGRAPAGMLNRTRLYVPARTLLGALIAEQARLEAQDFPEYGNVGVKLRKTIRLGYLYPAESVADQWKAWLPRYEEGEGLVWEREDGGAKKDERQFRPCLLFTRSGTAIAPESHSAAEGTLREFEVIGPFWRGDGTFFQRVAWVGYIFCKGGAPKLQLIQTLWVGGDTRYGLGQLRLLSCTPAPCFFGASVDLQGEAPVVKTDRVLAHTTACDFSLKGAMEEFGGWDGITGELAPSCLTWVPGSVLKDPQDFVIQEDGLWRKP